MIINDEILNTAEDLHRIFTCDRKVAVILMGLDAIKYRTQKKPIKANYPVLINGTQTMLDEKRILQVPIS